MYFEKMALFLKIQHVFAKKIQYSHNRTIMKKIIALSIVLFAFLSASWAQDRTKMRPKDRFIIGTFTDVWSGLPSGMETKALNRGITLDYVQEFPISTTNFSFAAGLGFTSNNLYSDHFYSYNFVGNRHEFTPIPESFDYSNNKLSLNYLNIPVEFRFRTRNTPRTFRIHAGLKAGLLVNAHTKYVGDYSLVPGFSTRETKIKEGKLENIESFLLGMHARVGYGRFNVHYFTNLTNIFEGNNAEDASFMSLGLSFILF